jgi:hypothetical protein
LIFDSIGAFLDLVENDIEAAAALLDERSLRRIADLGGFFEKIGPAYKIEDNEVITRLTLDHNADWDYGINKVEHLERAYKFMIEAAREGNKHFKRFKLKSGQGIIMANDKIAHGRTKFSESDSNKRKIVRGLFTSRPKLTAQL